MQSFRNGASCPPVHGTCLDFRGQGLLLTGASGSGKSDLALRLLDREGWRLVADDRVVLQRQDAGIRAQAPDALRGLIEVRGQGILELADHELSDSVNLDAVSCLSGSSDEIERFPDPAITELLGTNFPMLRMWPFEVSAPIKLERWLHTLQNARAQFSVAADAAVCGGRP